MKGTIHSNKKGAPKYPQNQTEFENAIGSDYKKGGLIEDISEIWPNSPKYSQT
jgi:hypothetical protein